MSPSSTKPRRGAAKRLAGRSNRRRRASSFSGTLLRSGCPPPASTGLGGQLGSGCPFRPGRLRRRGHLPTRWGGEGLLWGGGGLDLAARCFHFFERLLARVLVD